ncbi:MAG: peroxiredoxin [Methanoregula sp.]|nr:peroxiredoxin [Methanoregula sp.]
MPITILIVMASSPDPLIGKTAPAFCLPDVKGTEVCLEQFRKKWVVLYFYPRDNTPGCTLEAMQFNAALEKFADLGAQVIGVSTDSQESHQKFAEKRSLNILLLSDTEHWVLTAYDSWKPKTMFGKEFFGTQRDTFLINPSGIIVTVWRKVSVKGHAQEVKAVLLEKLKGSGNQE